MNVDEYRSHFERDDWIEDLADKILERLHCKHRAIRERSRAGWLVERQCVDCLDHLPDREFE